jgi:hypothetical protein
MFSRKTAGRLRRRKSMSKYFFQACIATVIITGCGQSDPRLPVSGSVQLAGQPLTSGTIEFEPIGAGRQAGGAITNGSFSLPASRGLPPGDYRVRITAAGGVPDAPVEGPPGPESMAKPPANAEKVPAKFNTKSELTATVVVDADNVFQFNLNN